MLYVSFLVISYILVSEASVDDNIIESTLKVGDNKYKVKCICPKGVHSIDDVLRSDDIRSCLSVNTKIKKNQYVTDDLLSDILDFSQMPLERYDYVKNSHFSSIDSRTRHPSYFSPGGDLGDFIILLSNVTTPKPWDFDSVSDVLKAYLSALPASRLFYHSTDIKAVNSLAQEFGQQSLNIFNVPKEFQEKALYKLTKPENNGDIFIKNLLKHPDEFNVAVSLVRLVIQSFYKLLWDTSDKLSEKLLLEIMVGDIDPQLFIELSSSNKCEINGILPKCSPRINDRQVVIYSESASHYRRKEIAKFANRYFNENYSAMIDKLNYHTYKAIDQLGKTLGKDMPFVQLTLT